MACVSRWMSFGFSGPGGVRKERAHGGGGRGAVVRDRGDPARQPRRSTQIAPMARGGDYPCSTTPTAPNSRIIASTAAWS